MRETRLEDEGKKKSDCLLLLVGEKTKGKNTL